MRFELLLLLSLACLAFTAQAAPASAQDVQLQHKAKKQNSGRSKQHGSKPERHHHSQPQHRDHHQKPFHSDHGTTPKHTRNLEGGGLKAAEEAKSFFVPDIESKLHAKLNNMEKASLVQEKKKLHEIQVEDTKHTAKYGGTPPKFPTITVSSPSV